MWFASRSKTASDELAALKEIRDRSELLDEACGIGLWATVIHEGDPKHPLTRYTWSAEFRRLLGFEYEADFPNVVQSWTDRLHPEDLEPTFASFASQKPDATGTTRHDVNYRLRMRDDSYRWFRATGACRYAPDGTMLQSCGSLTDIHKQKLAEFAAEAEAEADRAAIEALRHALAALAAGDLTARIDQPLGAKSEPLRIDFNSAAAEIRHAMAQIASKQDAIRSGAGEITGVADDLSHRTEQQASSLEETAAALDEITATVKKTAEGAKHARDVVGMAKSDAERSGAVVRRAVEAMSSIEKSSVQIGQIIGVIDEIAFQTNLLALNAGVEAARAGEAGRGFAVVASEVRALAQRSAEAAKEIKSLITSSDDQVKVGVELVGETGRALTRIVEQVGDINNSVAGIAASAQEQAAGLQQVNTAINQMDQVTQKNAAMVEETTAAAHMLAQDAEELARLTGRFQVGEVEGEARSAGRRAPARLPAREPKPMPARKVAGRGGAARKPEPAAETEWEEF